jgi:hypothetical protein
VQHCCRRDKSLFLVTKKPCHEKQDKKLLTKKIDSKHFAESPTKAKWKYVP